MLSDNVPFSSLVLSTASPNQRLDQFLAKALQPHVECIFRTRIQRWIALGAVRVDGEVRR